MASNTVEATLLSKFEDGISRGISQTEKTLGQAFGNIKNASATLSSGVEAAFGSIVQGIDSFRERLRQTAEQSDNEFTKMSAGAAAVALVVVAAFLKAAKAVSDFVFELVRESSKAIEAKIAFESLTGAQGMQADVISKRLKVATDGLVSGTVLLTNANRVLQSHIPLTMDQFTKLTENVYRMAKAHGVDATQAINTMTDGLIRGNGRGLQAIGIHLAVKDAITGMAEAMGQTHLADHSRLQAFYNELLAKSAEEVGRLGPKFFTLEDVINQTDLTWKGFVSSMGQAINRSQVLQEAIKLLNKELLGTGATKEGLNQLTLSANRFFLGAMEGAAGLLQVLAVLSVAWDVLWGAIKVVVNSAASLLFMLFRPIRMLLTGIYEDLSRLPGAVGKFFRQAAEESRFMRDYQDKALKEFLNGAATAFDGTGDTSEKLKKMAASVSAAGAELSKYQEGVVSGSAGTTTFGNDAVSAAGKVKELAEQVKKFEEVRRDLANKNASPEVRAIDELIQYYRKVDELTRIGEDKRNELKRAALLNYDAELQRIHGKEFEDARKLAEEQADLDRQSAALRGNTNSAELALETLFHAKEIALAKAASDAIEKLRDERLKRDEEARKKELDGVLSMASAIQRAISLSRSGKIGSDVGLDAFAQIPKVIADLQTQLNKLHTMKLLDERQLEEIVKLKTKIEELNKINLSPFQQAVAGMRQSLTQFTQQGTEAFAQFFSNLVSGQEGAGRKLLGAFVGMIGQMLVHMGVILVQSGIAEIALAQTLVGRLMGASVAGGLKAIAIGALIAAFGGALEGASANMSQSSAATGDTAATGQTNSTPTQVPVINVGAPGGAQNPGRTDNKPQVLGEVHLVIAPTDAYVVRTVERNVGNNGRLRAVIRNA